MSPRVNVQVGRRTREIIQSSTAGKVSQQIKFTRGRNSWAQFQLHPKSMKEYVNICATRKYDNATPFHRVAKCIRTQHQRFLTHSNPISVWFRWCTTTAVMFGFPEHTQNCTYKFSHHRGPFLRLFRTCLLHNFRTSEHYYPSRWHWRCRDPSHWLWHAALLSAGCKYIYIYTYTHMYARWNTLLKEVLNKKTGLQKRAC